MTTALERLARIGLCFGLFAAVCPLASSEITGFTGWRPGLQRFELQRGKGVPVCEAYTTMLRNLEFTRAPFCGRVPMEISPGSGFEPLPWKVLSADTEYALALVAPLYFRSGRPDAAQKTWAESDRLAGLRNASPPTNSRSFREEFQAGVRGEVERSRRAGLSVNAPFEVGPPMDINNDGVTDRVAILPDTGAICGAVRRTEPEMVGNHAVVLDSQGRFDFQATDEVFRDPVPYRVELLAKGRRIETDAPQPRYLVDSVSITRFSGVFYFDGVSSRSVPDAPKKAVSGPLSTISVFEHSKGISHLRCEINWVGAATAGTQR